jgi:riboflavin kinase/FMN adenylyltransferase
VEVITDLAACTGWTGAVVTIGAYDGVHRGHRAILAQVRAMADAAGTAAAVVTFDRHPATVVRPESAPKLLTDLDQKLELLAAEEVDVCVVVHFDEHRARQSADDFVGEVLVDCLAARAVVVGHDFHFGHRRGGDVALLRRRGEELGFEVHDLRLVGDGAEPISSTRIRALLSAGEVEAAAGLLGRPYQVRGTVGRGDARGRRLGYPTANVTVPPAILLPADGIYAGWYQRPGGEVHRAAISLGRRPTFHPGATRPVLEAHLLDFDGQLYGEAARVRFVTRLRGEERFDSGDELVAQMSRDVEAARLALA